MSWELADLCAWEVLLASQIGKADTMITDMLTRKEHIQKTLKDLARGSPEMFFKSHIEVLLKIKFHGRKNIHLHAIH